jgi:flagellar biosynthetic protein FliR
VNTTALASPFAPETLVSLVLLASRVGGVVLIAPVFSTRLIPVTVRTALVILLTIVLHPAARSVAGPRGITPAAVLGEMLIGFTIGLGAALIIGAAEVAGEYMSLQIGISGAALLDPLSNQQTSVLGTFLQLFAVTILLSVGGHLLMLEALAECTRQLPLGGALGSERGLLDLASLGGTLFSFGLRFAAPVIAVALVANVALAVLSRAAPQLNILQLAFPVQILVGLVTLLAAIPILGSWLAGWETSYTDVLRSALGALGGR